MRTFLNHQSLEEDIYVYRESFYRYLSGFAKSSARKIIPVLNSVVPIYSVVDFGCGLGGWLSAWKEAGAMVVGLDGHYIDQKYLMIDRREFIAADLTKPIDLGRQFDLVQSLEVAEHIPMDSAENFVNTLVAHGRLIMFSAALPGQGGEHHVNEQPMEYWRALFRRRGYVAVDFVRAKIIDTSEIQHWYRYNIVLYAHQTLLHDLPRCLTDYVVPEDQSLRNMWPFFYRVQHQILRQLPIGIIDLVSRIKSARTARRSKKERTNKTAASNTGPAAEN